MEGPSVKAVADKLRFIKDLRVVDISGNTKSNKEGLKGDKVVDIYSIGKRLVMETENGAAIIHFLMYGSYRINEQREGMTPRLSLELGGSRVSFYNCSVRILTKKEVGVLDRKSDGFPCKQCGLWQVVTCL